ncbi:hypothetical protein BPNPMPFG_003304 [Mesorhizobium sp. AR07]|uniref:hypothetical protein n=1 Tax=Mesorhizobium sp. AR07 TaxID=2865838 RepID=UPI00216008AF|nr:hypothetical protein [Mesorhizobium sp. AR07]UVK48015.1 hypothetical protein BPNPMPFG_003304 [Mesorhizobium sp. AR07]
MASEHSSRKAVGQALKRFVGLQTLDELQQFTAYLEHCYLTPGTPGTPGTAAHPNLPSVVGDMSSGQLVRMKKRCADVLGNSAFYDRDLRQLCLLIARR